MTVIQRFGSALNLNLHFHVLILDGLFVPGTGGLPRFQRARPWTQADVDRLVETIATRCKALLARRGHGPDGQPGAGELSEDDDACPIIQSTAEAGRSAVRPGPRRGPDTGRVLAGLKRDTRGPPARAAVGAAVRAGA